MLRWLIGKRLNAAEKKLGVPLDYMRHILRISPRAFFKFIKVMPLAEFRRTLRAGPYHVARMVATRHEDCGSCVQIVVNQARQDGMDSQTLRAALEGNVAALPAELAEAYRFAEAIVTRSADEVACRDRIRQRFGDAGLIELGLAVATCRIFPTTKRALGYATSCSQGRVDTG